ncbi:MAG: hypothetical protein ACOC8E_06430, partial [Planctomycetota bacterium]
PEELRSRYAPSVGRLFGDTQYAGYPHRETVSLILATWPDAIGYSTMHGTAKTWRGVNKGEGVPARYSECVWSEGRLGHRRYESLPKPDRRHRAWCTFARNRHHESVALQVYRQLPQEMIMRGMDGVGPFGGDLWPIRRKKSGRWYNVSGNSALGPGCSTRAILAPGPDGAVATERFEMYREGVQLCEAIFFLQRALDGGKLPKKLADRVDTKLDWWSRRFLRLYGRPRYSQAVYLPAAPPPEADHELYELCAEVEAQRKKNQ